MRTFRKSIQAEESPHSKVPTRANHKAVWLPQGGSRADNDLEDYKEFLGVIKSFEDQPDEGKDTETDQEQDSNKSEFGVLVASETKASHS